MAILSFSLVVVILLLTILYSAVNKLRHLPPSPPLSFPLIGHLYLLNRRLPLHRSLADVSRRWGPLLYLRLGSVPVVLVSDPAAAEECLTVNDVVSANRPRFVAGKYVGYDYKSLEWAPYGTYWRNLRLLATVHVLSLSESSFSLAYAPMWLAREFIRRLFKECSESENPIVEMKSALFKLTLNNVMKMITGNAVEETTEAVRSYRKRVERTFVGGGALDIGHDFVPLLGWFSGGNQRFVRILKELHSEDDGFVQELIDGCRKMKKTTNEVGDEEEDE